MTGQPWRVNCYLVTDERTKSAMLVDPGANAELIIGEVRRRDALVTHVLLTHGHHDHVGAVASVCRELGVSSWIHEADRRLLRQAALYAYRFAGKTIEEPRPVSVFQERTIPFGSDAVEIIHTPGHTPGGVTFAFAGFALTGDTLLHQHVGRTDLPGADARLLSQSVTRLLDMLPGPTTLLAGHGRAWTVDAARAWWSGVYDAPPTLSRHESP